MKPIRIVLAEDHILVREGTRRILEQYPDLKVVGEAGDGEEALNLIRRLRPDVAILDIRMPKLNGIEIVRRMNNESDMETKALILSAYDDDDYIFAMMQAGASGYLLKTAQSNELAESIRAIHSGETVLQPAIASKVARLWGQHSVSTSRGVVKKISIRELEILRLAAKGMRNKDIADNLSISVRTVEGHFNSIYAKMNVSSRIEAILYALSMGLVSLEEKANQNLDRN